MVSNTEFQTKRYKLAIKKTTNALKNTFPSLLGVLLLIAVVQQFDISKLSHLFIGNPLWDSTIGSIIGSVAAGNPITSYVIGGELLEEGVSIFAVTAFVLAWVTVGVVQFPAESIILGRRFALVRNLSSFILAILVSMAVVVSTGFIS